MSTDQSASTSVKPVGRIIQLDESQAAAKSRNIPHLLAHVHAQSAEVDVGLPDPDALSANNRDLLRSVLGLLLDVDRLTACTNAQHLKEHLEGATKLVASLAQLSVAWVELLVSWACCEKLIKIAEADFEILGRTENWSRHALTALEPFTHNARAMECFTRNAVPEGQSTCHERLVRLMLKQTDQSMLPVIGGLLHRTHFYESLRQLRDNLSVDEEVDLRTVTHHITEVHRLYATNLDALTIVTEESASFANEQRSDAFVHTMLREFSFPQLLKSCVNLLPTAHAAHSVEHAALGRLANLWIDTICTSQSLTMLFAADPDAMQCLIQRLKSVGQTAHREEEIDCAALPPMYESESVSPTSSSSTPPSDPRRQPSKKPLARRRMKLPSQLMAYRKQQYKTLESPPKTFYKGYARGNCAMQHRSAAAGGRPQNYQRRY